MQFGTVSKQTQFIGGVAVCDVLIKTESIRVNSIEEAKQHFNSLVDDYLAGKLFNPGIQMEVYPDTGKIKRVVKSWSEKV